MGEKIILLIPVLLCLGSLYYWRKLKWNLRETALACWTYFCGSRGFIILLTIGYLAVSVGMCFLFTADAAGVTISLDYSGASNGLNPNETRFNATEMLSDEVLERAIENGALEGVTVEDLKDSLWLGAIGGNTQALTVYDTEESYKIGTEYYISYSETEQTKHLDGDMLIRLVAYAYYDYFMDSYSDKHGLLEITDEELADLDQVDYLDMVNYFTMRGEELERYMLNYQTRNGSYQSAKTQETFASMRGKIKKFLDIDLERFEAYILTCGLSKDADRYIGKLNFENMMEDIKYQKNWSSYQIRLDAIERYHREMARIVLVPTEDETEEFYMSRTKIGVDYLANEAEDNLKSATDRKLEIDTNSHAINQLETGNPTGAQFERIETMVTELKEELVSLAERTDDLLTEYISEKESSYLNMTFHSMRTLDYVPVKRLIVYGVLFALAFTALLAFRERAGKLRGKLKKSKKKAGRQFARG